MGQLAEVGEYVAIFHQELQEQLYQNAEIWLQDMDCNEEWIGEWQEKENVCDVFVKMKARFLVYAPFVIQCSNVEKQIDLFLVDASVKSEIEQLERELHCEMTQSRNFQRPTTFNSLLALPFQHVLRYDSV